MLVVRFYAKDPLTDVYIIRNVFCKAVYKADERNFIVEHLNDPTTEKISLRSLISIRPVELEYVEKETIYEE